MADLVIQENKKGKTLILEFSGDVDESAEFAKVKVQNVSELIVNAGQINEINSWGVREWVKWVATLPKDIKITLVNCPQVIINQINMISGFLPKGAVIESFYVPYFCNSCDHTASILFNPSPNDTKETILKSRMALCEKCGTNAEWDVVANTYFKFLKSK